MSNRLPTHTLRLFAHYEDIERLPVAAPALVMARLMEEGDSSDLRWLTRVYPERHLSSWLDEHGSRLLSRRSQVFWRILLDRPDSVAAAPGEQLWPL